MCICVLSGQLETLFILVEYYILTVIIFCVNIRLLLLSASSTYLLEFSMYSVLNSACLEVVIISN